MNGDAALQRLWYGPRWMSLPLWPLAWLFRAVVAVRTFLYRAGMLRAHRLSVPVIVVGNISVGGTGKTPVAGWLARALALRGHRVGVVLRGYGGKSSQEVRVVTPDSDPGEVGDEAVIHALSGPPRAGERSAAAGRAAARAARAPRVRRCRRVHPARSPDASRADGAATVDRHCAAHAR